VTVDASRDLAIIHADERILDAYRDGLPVPSQPEEIE